MFGGEGLVATISPTLGCKALQANKTGDGQDLRHPHPCPSLLGIGVSITTAMALRTSIVTLKALAGGHNPGCFVSQFPRRQRIVRSSNYGHGRDAYRLFSLTSPRDGPHYHNCETSASNLGRQIAEVLRNKGTRLILHLDVNKTLIMVDPSGGKTQSQVLNSILAEISWGQVEIVDGKTDWKWDGGPPSLDTPSAPVHPTEVPWDKVTEELDSSPLLTYSDFLHETFADETGGVSNPRMMKEARDDRKGSFTEEGQPGAGLREEYLRLTQALDLPQSVSSSPLAREAGLAGRDSFYIVPSFFKCILALKEANADFALVFRTFGGDIAGVAAEHNAFCEGKHPLFPGVKMDGTDGQADYRVHLEDFPNVGAFFRDEEGVALVMGTLDSPLSREHLRAAEEKGHAVHRSIRDIHDAMCNAVCSPSTSGKPMDSRWPVDSALSEKGRNRKCLALKDFYPYWRTKLEVAEAGKVLTIEPSENPKVWPIMVDDNIGRLCRDADAHIADVRDITNDETVRFDVATRRHIVRAEPYLVITSSHNFFLTRILERLALPSEDTAKIYADTFPEP